MSPSASDRRAQRGLTLVEVVVALAASGILTVGLVVFFRGFNRSYNMQEQVADRDLNAHYTIKRISETLMATGWSLPADGWSLIDLPEGNPGPRLKVGVNPCGGVQYLAAPLPGLLEIPVDDIKGFAKATAVLCDPLAVGLATFKTDIDTTYDADGFAKGLKSTGTGGLVRVTSPVTLEPGDAVYAFDVEDFRLQDGNLMLDGNVLAEGIQTLEFSFFTAGQALTTQWSAMRSARIRVSARTRTSDPGYAENGGYRTLELSMDVLLRNRL
jgi:prepilin-type N-terminal cleavage/methylation domain-containing protein